MYSSNQCDLNVMLYLLIPMWQSYFHVCTDGGGGSVKYRAEKVFVGNMDPKIASQSWLCLAAKRQQGTHSVSTLW